MTAKRTTIPFVCILCIRKVRPDAVDDHVDDDFKTNIWN